MDSGRLQRREEISKALKFIQSSLAYPDPEGYQDFLTDLVCNLLEEGNALFKDTSWEKAMKEFSEGLNVAEYAASEDIFIPNVLMESLHVNRAAAYYNMGEFLRGVEDCDKALALCKDSHRALYRKALCLKELGMYREAYSCTTDCLLISRMDSQVNELAQDLAVHLGLKIRKPYVSAKKEDLATQVVTTNGTTKHEQMCMEHTTESAATKTNGNFSSKDETFLADQARSQTAVSSVPEMTDDSELILDDLDSLLDTFPNNPEATEAFLAPGLLPPSLHTVPSALPDPTPQLPPAFFSSSGVQMNNLSSFLSGDSALSALDVLDDVSDSVGLSALSPPSAVSLGTAASKALPPTTQNSLDDLDSLDDLSFVNTEQEAPTVNHVSEKSVEKALEVSEERLNGDSGLNSLDALDLFPSMGNVAATVGAGLDSLSDFTLNGESDHLSPAPLKPDKEVNKGSPAKRCKSFTSTHQFMQACSTCYPRTGRGIYSFVHKPGLAHNCEKDVLLCRKKDGVLPWTRVRPMPLTLWTSFNGPFVLCREIQQSGDLGLCQYGENCTYAFNQLEIDVWTEERKGTFQRDLLFEKPALKRGPVKGIIQILEENKGMFIFLCGLCFDLKPTIISKRSKDDCSVCSNADARHSFEANKCLAFVIGNITVRYKKVRVLHIQCQLDLCRHSIRYGCRLGDGCAFAHSDVELKAWKLQRETGTTADEMVKVSADYYEKHNKDFSYKSHHSIKKPHGTNKPKGARPKERLNMRMKFVCGHCWRDGVMSDPDKALKHCSAKAKHMWTKDKRILMVRSLERTKWVMVRSLPHCKHFPLHYDICHRILNHGRCNVGNCTFAHSQEEKDMWTYMKNNTLVDMQQVYDMWLTLSAPSQQKDEPTSSLPPPEEKNIAMPTDYEAMDGFHCRLCGRHSNSERQWQQHISSEKHKDRVFTCDEEDKALTWNYRFPAKYFQLCPRFADHCPDGVSCDYAHGLEELQEWNERREFFKRKLKRAKDDMLIMPDESDFGKYNFLLQD